MKRNWEICNSCSQVHKHKKHNSIHCEASTQMEQRRWFWKSIWNNMELPENCICRLEHLTLVPKNAGREMGYKSPREETINTRRLLESLDD